MRASTSEVNELIKTLEDQASQYGVSLDSESLHRLGNYFSLVTHWNQRLHLVAPCSPPEFATRHLLESLWLTRYLPTRAAIADIGSGAGLPMIPCLIVRPDLDAHLIESSRKKAIFLHEALKVAGSKAEIIVGRFEETESPPVQFISCRAIEKFEELLPRIVSWAPKPATLLLFGGQGLTTVLDSLGITYKADLVPRSERRFLYIAR